MFLIDEFRDAANKSRSVDRRLFLSYLASLSAIPLMDRVGLSQTSNQSFADYPFRLGVASGDPSHEGTVLWTRLAPQPLESGFGMSPEPIEVAWELADDEKFANVRKRGIATATSQLGHSVHVEVGGLQPDRWYFYRFRAGDAESPIGRTRTMPLPDVLPDKMRFAFASCQHYEAGFYTAYEHMSENDFDLVFHLGDYIYEGKGQNGKIRKHIGREIRSLEQYRIRHGQYRSDPQLQAMHASCPWMVTWDDHEFDNNYANDISEKPGVDPVKFLVRRANAYQAYYEAMPLSRRSLPRGPNMRLYRSVSFGRLANALVLDTRQYRTDQPNSDKQHELNDAACSEHNSLLGKKQRDWMQGELGSSPASWNILAQQVMMGAVDRASGDVKGYSMDQWPGCLHERNQLLTFLGERRVSNPVVLTGDIHSNWVNDLRVDDFDLDSPVVATEFVGTSICSGGNGLAAPPYLNDLLRENPNVKFHNAERGYVACELTPKTWTSDFFVVNDVTQLGGTVSKRASFTVESGVPSAHIS